MALIIVKTKQKIVWCVLTFEMSNKIVLSLLGAFFNTKIKTLNRKTSFVKGKSRRLVSDRQQDFLCGVQHRVAGGKVQKDTRVLGRFDKGFSPL